MSPNLVKISQETKKFQILGDLEFLCNLYLTTRHLVQYMISPNLVRISQQTIFLQILWWGDINSFSYILYTTLQLGVVHFLTAVLIV